MSASLPVTGNTQHTHPENRVHYPALDGLRALAFLLVFFYHFLSLPWGWCGVTIFFVLSGFLITGILLDTRDTPSRVRNFYVRRTLRIFPLYWGVFLLIFLTTPLFGWKWSLSWLAWPLYVGNYLRYVSPSAMQLGSPLYSAASGILRSSRAHGTVLFVGHFWSLCVEEQFYLLWPWVIFYLRRGRALAFSVAIVIALPVVRAILHAVLPGWMVQEDILYRTTCFQLDALVLGAVLAFLWRGAHREFLLRLGRVALPVLLLLGAVFLVMGLHQSAPHYIAGYIYPSWEYTWGLTFFNLLGAALILNTLRPSSLAARLFSWRPARRLGRISYGAYVFHNIFSGTFAIPAKRLAMHFGVPKLRAMDIGNHWAWVFALPATIVVSWISFRFWESPFLNLKDRWTIHTRRAEQTVQ